MTNLQLLEETDKRITYLIEILKLCKDDLTICTPELSFILGITEIDLRKFYILDFGEYKIEDLMKMKRRLIEYLL